MYSFKGQLKKTEYYRLVMWEYKEVFLWAAVIATLLLGSVIYLIDLPFTLILSDSMRDFLLSSWLSYFFLFLIALCLFVFLFRGLMYSKLALFEKEYYVSEEGLTVRDKQREVRVYWSDIRKWKLTRRGILLRSPYVEYAYIPNRFFESQGQRDEVVLMMQKRIGGNNR